MGNTSTSNEAGKKKNKKEIPTEQKDNLDKELQEFTGNPNTTLFAGCGMFETTMENLKDVDVDTSSSDGTGAGGHIKMENQIIQTLENVEQPGVFITMHEKAKSKDDKSSKKDREDDGNEIEEDGKDEK